jgi:hypothetical protein
MGYKKAEKHYVTIGFDTSSPNDTTEYRFLKTNVALSAVGLLDRFVPPENIIFTKLTIAMYSQAAYTDEPWTIFLRETQVGTDIATVTLIKPLAGGAYCYGTIDMSQLASPPSCYQLKTVTPAWATNPLAIRGIGTLEYIIL